MTPEDNQFLKAFFNATSDRPLEPGDPRYDEASTDADPVQQLPQAYRTLQQVVDKRRDRRRLLGQGVRLSTAWSAAPAVRHQLAA